MSNLSFTIYSPRFVGEAGNLPFRKGQTLIEVVVALGVVVALAVSLVSTSLITQKSARTARNNTQATKLVQQSIEQIRVFRDRKGYANLTLAGGVPQYIGNTTNSDPSAWSLVLNQESLPLNNTTFTRWIVIEELDPNKKKKVTVNVTWNEPSGQLSVSNVTFLSNCVNTATSC